MRRLRWLPRLCALFRALQGPPDGLVLAGTGAGALTRSAVRRKGGALKARFDI